jgi:hypothetical protein
MWGCHNALFAMDVTMFYMKAMTLNRRMKLLVKTAENVQNVTENFHCYQLMSKLSRLLNADKEMPESLHKLFSD